MGNIFKSMSRCGVQLFLMLSGALMLNEKKQNDVNKMIKNSIQMLGILLLWCAIYVITHKMLFVKLGIVDVIFL